MPKESHFIHGEWVEGLGENFASYNPVTDRVNWEGSEATQDEVAEAVLSAKKSLPAWRALSFDQRCAFVRQFAEELITNQDSFAKAICKEMGKPLWEAKLEVSAMLQKIEISIEAFKERCPDKVLHTPTSTLTLHHKPHGVVSVFGPFNFPGHLPNAHIIPALIAGNTVVFKGSEKTPLVSEMLIRLHKALPKGVLNMIQGGVLAGHYLLTHPKIDGVFFTGSHQTGLVIFDALKAHPEKIIALEMGGNNPLIISDISDLEATAYWTIQSAFITSGQRCSCTRRLIVLDGKEGDEFLKVLTHMTESIQVGPYTQAPEPFMGPVISAEIAEKLLTTQAVLGSRGGKCLVEMHPVNENNALITPGIMDITHVLLHVDQELFGPFLQVMRVPSFEVAIEEANRTAYGLSAALFSHSKEKFKQFYEEIRAGVINWNTPTTGASAKLPFGGIGKSGNHHPSGYYAADYCSYPVASTLSEEIHTPKPPTPGVTFLART